MQMHYAIRLSILMKFHIQPAAQEEKIARVELQRDIFGIADNFYGIVN